MNSGAMDKESVSAGSEKEVGSDETVPMEAEPSTSNVEKSVEEKRRIAKTLIQNSKLKLRLMFNSPEFERSWRPLKCPHGPCGQRIAICDFKTHYRFQHRDLNYYTLERGMELRIQLNLDLVEQGQNKCIGIIIMNLTEDKAIHPEAAPRKQEKYEHFWIMVSKSKTDEQSIASVMFWLFSENQNVRCSMRISPDQHYKQMQAEFGVSTLEESQNIEVVMDKQNCLRMPYKSIRSILEYRHEVLLNIIIR